MWFCPCVSPHRTDFFYGRSLNYDFDEFVNRWIFQQDSPSVDANLPYRVITFLCQTE